MRILHLNTETGFRGGERQVLLLARKLKERGHEQLVVGRENGKLIPAIEELGIDTAGYTRPGLLGIRSPALVRRMRHLASEFNADIVHAHTGNAHTLAHAAFDGRLPVVVTRRVDFPVKANRFSRSKYLDEGIHFIAISNGVKEVLRAGGVPDAHIDVVHSGVDVARVTGGDGSRLRESWLGNGEGPLIGFIGALVDHKAPWILAEASSQVLETFPKARFVFIGDGEERDRILESAGSARANLVMAGWRDDIADCYAALDMFVMPSKLEGLCTSLIDALAAGVPAIASRTGGIPDVIEDGECGDLVEPLNAGALAEAITSVWKDQERRARYIQSGQARVQRLFTAAAMAEGNERVYQRILRG